MKAKNIGIDVKTPEKECEDPLCPFHGSIKVRGKTLVGKVVSDKMSKTVSVQWDRTEFLPKFERFIKKRSKVNAHNPKCINANKGDIVKIAETRPMSKTKNFVVIEVIGAQRKVESDKDVAEERAKARKVIHKKEEVKAKDDDAKEDKE